jgi:hypothetical protein
MDLDEDIPGLLLGNTTLEERRLSFSRKNSVSL